MISDLSIVLYFGSLLLSSYHYLRGPFELALCRPLSNSTTHSARVAPPHPADTPDTVTIVPWACCFSPHPVNRWTLLVLTPLLFINAYCYSYIVVVFTDKFRSKPLVSPLSLTADKLASSPSLPSAWINSSLYISCSRLLKLNLPTRLPATTQYAQYEP